MVNAYTIKKKQNILPQHPNKAIDRHVYRVGLAVNEISLLKTQMKEKILK